MFISRKKGPMDGRTFLMTFPAFALRSPQPGARSTHRKRPVMDLWQALGPFQWQLDQFLKQESKFKKFSRNLKWLKLFALSKLQILGAAPPGQMPARPLVQERQDLVPKCAKRTGFPHPVPDSNKSVCHPVKPSPPFY